MTSSFNARPIQSCEKAKRTLYNTADQTDEEITAALKQILKEDEQSQALSQEVWLTYQLYLARYLFVACISTEDDPYNLFFQQWIERWKKTDTDRTQIRALHSHVYKPVQSLWLKMTEADQELLMQGFDTQLNLIADVVFRYSTSFMRIFNEKHLPVIEISTASFSPYLFSKVLLEKFSPSMATFLLDMHDGKFKFLEWEEHFLNYPHPESKQINERSEVPSYEWWEKMRRALPVLKTNLFERFPVSSFQFLEKNAKEKPPQFFLFLLANPALPTFIYENIIHIKAYTDYYAAFQRNVNLKLKGVIATSFEPNASRSGSLKSRPLKRDEKNALTLTPAQLEKLHWDENEWAEEQARRDDTFALLKQQSETPSAEAKKVDDVHKKRIEFIASVLKAREVVAEAEAKAKTNPNAQTNTEAHANGSETVANANGKQAVTEETKKLALRPIFSR